MSSSRFTCTLLGLFTVSLVPLLFGCGCDLERMGLDDKQVMVMTYNVQNVFDPFVTGREYPEYTPEGGWSADHYHKRLERLSRAITQGHEMVPDIVLLQEIEHAGVLEDLVRLHLYRWGYQWFAATDDHDSPIQTGIISRYPITSVVIHRVQGTRSILESSVDIAGNEVRIFNLHAKSRREGVEETESLRVATARALSSRTRELVEMHPFLPLVIAGDFNESADAAVREGHAFQHALVPLDNPHATACIDAGSLAVTGNHPVPFSWYTWWLDRKISLMAGSDGSYLHQGVWESYDQLLLSPAFFDGFGLEFSDGYVAAFPPLCDENGHPDAWDVRAGRGFSDHLPVSVVLSWK